MAILETDLFHSFMNWAALQKSCFGQKFRQIKANFLNAFKLDGSRSSLNAMELLVNFIFSVFLHFVLSCVIVATVPRAAPTCSLNNSCVGPRSRDQVFPVLSVLSESETLTQ